MISDFSSNVNSIDDITSTILGEIKFMYETSCIHSYNQHILNNLI